MPKKTRKNKRDLTVPKRGPPIKLNVELMNRAALMVESGCYIETACEACGIGRSTYYDWLRWGAEGRDPYAAFYDRLTQARATAEAKHVMTIDHATTDDWHAAAWLLERTRGRSYSGVTVTEARIDLDVKSIEEIGNKVRQIYAIAPPLLTANTQPIDAEFEDVEKSEEAGASADTGEPPPADDTPGTRPAT